MAVDVNGSQETYFAQHLAANDPKIRNRAIKKLGRWLIARSSGGHCIAEDDLLKIWKGLFYCMWMSDKPLVQEALADRICSLVHSFGNTESTLTFIDTFFQTMSREWFGIDRFRLEKYMMLVRRFFHQCFLYLKAQKWNSSLVIKVLQIMEKTVLNPFNDDTSNGLKFHTFDVFVDELQKAGGYKLKTKQICIFLKPFGEFLVHCNDQLLCSSVVKAVFHSFIYDAVEYDDVVNASADTKFQIDFGFIADRLIELASRDDIRENNRARIYKIVGHYRDTAQGVFPFDRKIDSDSGTDLGEEDINNAAERLIKETGNRRKKFSKKKNSRKH